MGGLLIFDIETTGLDPKVDKIVGIGLKDENSEKIFKSEDEKKIIKYFWSGLPAEDVTLVSFDSDITLPFLIERTKLHKIKRHPLKALDLQKVFKFKDSKNFDITFFKPNKNIILWKNEKDKMLKQHIESNLRVTHNIIQMAKEVDLI